MDLYWYDYVRLLVFVFFGLTLGESLWIFRKYTRLIKTTRRLLPLHVVTISISTLGMEMLIAHAVAERLGEPPTLTSFLSALFTFMTWYALWTVRHHITRKANLHEQVSPLLHEADETP